jgi:superoxide dismutase, Cu-Zn family
MRSLVLAVFALALLLATPTAQAARPAPTSATAHIVDATGRFVGEAKFTSLAAGAVQVHVQVAGFAPGPGGDHGVHVHAVGKCEGPAFTSAGGHLNPAGKQHGLANPAGPHAGDLPNLQFYPDGSGAFTATTTAFTLSALVDTDGSAIVIHAAPDDLHTDPSGNSGARIGCGVIVADTSTLAPAQQAAGTTVAMTTASAASKSVGRAAAQPAGAAAHIIDATGRTVGTATFTALAAGAVQVHVQVAGFAPGPGGDHGVHIHAVGKCEGPAFTSAGGHLNPAGKQHGLANPAGPHAGDLPNLQLYPDGSGAFTATTSAFTLAALADADGSAIVIHAAPDDLHTDPSGNSGARIGCGVIVADTANQP